MPIRKLSPLLINQIAAGEVIERPASVVKELVENSLDAGASRVDVAIEEGGLQLIRISDDGHGIPPDELPLAIAPHATSKLQSAEQLAAIATLGFRGEALASIASVSRLRITSRATRDGAAAEAAAVIEASGDEVSDVQPAAGSPGTVIEVRDLFFNTPARRKFMRAASTEFGHIGETMTRLAMVHRHVAFSLSHNGRKTMDLIATESKRQRCVDLLGKELDEALLEFEEIADRGSRNADLQSAAAVASSNPHSAIHIPQFSASVWGLAGLPAIARATAKFQYLCINGRFIRDRSLAHAIKEAYRGLVPPDRQPVAVVFITIDPTLVDVNVHPTKAEVRFRDGNRLHGLVLSAIRSRLLGADLTPSATVTMTGRTLDLREASEHASQPSSLYGSAPSTAARGFANETPVSSFSPSEPVTSAESTTAFVDYFRRMAPVQKGFVYQQVREAMAEVDPGLASDPAALSQPSLPASAEANSSVPPVLRSFGVLQVHKSYLVTEDEHGILIIDQHALHERVMFEHLRQRVTARNLESQRLLMPTVVRANAKRQALLEGLAPLLEKIGIEAEPMGPDAVAIHAFPTFLFDRKVEPAEFLGELLDQAEDEKLDASTPTAMEAALHEVLDMMSCKAAVKAGDKLTPDELAALLSKRDEVERASNCPHGRPTTIRLTLRDLEKQFGRT